MRPPAGASAVGVGVLVATAASSQTPAASATPATNFSCTVTCKGVNYTMSAACPAGRVQHCQCHRRRYGVIICK
jgi:hypothetical protein